MISYECFVNNFFSVFLEGVPKKPRDCETVNLAPITDMEGSPKFDGPCYIFSLKVAANSYAFDISFLDELENVREYKSQFSVGAYLEKSKNELTVAGDQLELNIFDKVYESSTVYSYKFNSEDMPFSWQSYGQYLTIMVNTSFEHDESRTLWIIVNAIFQSKILYSYLFQPISDILDVECFISGRFSIGFKTCFSISKQFSGNFLESQEVCRSRNAVIWSAKNAYEWTSVMQSGVFYWYLDEDFNQPVAYDGRINAVALLRSSSVMYVGNLKHQNEVIPLFFVVFIVIF